jgi:hypothetical protein
MKFKLLAMLTVALFVSNAAVAQVEIGGIAMPKLMKVDGEYLKMNGGGIRQKLWMDLYVGVLYVSNKSSDANTVMNADEAMAIKMRIISGMVSNSKLEGAVREGMDKSTGGKMAAMQDRLESLIEKGFAADVADGDVFDLIYQPGKGTTLQKNGKVLVTVEGLDFKKALFGVWLCDEPADENLKKKMLGQ